MFQTAKCKIEHQENQKQCYRHRNAQPGFGGFEIFKSSAIGNIICCRKLKPGIYFLLKLPNHALYIPSTNIKSDNDPSLRIFSLYLVRPFGYLNICNLA